MKSITLVLSILVLATAMFAQEPVNHAVSQPVALQPVAMQPAARESSALQIVHYVPPAPYLSEPLIIPPKQAVAHERPHPVITDPHQSIARQSSACGCNSN